MIVISSYYAVEYFARFSARHITCTPPPPMRRTPGLITMKLLWYYCNMYFHFAACTYCFLCIPGPPQTSEAKINSTQPSAVVGDTVHVLCTVTTLACPTNITLSFSQFFLSELQTLPVSLQTRSRYEPCIDRRRRFTRHILFPNISHSATGYYVCTAGNQYGQVESRQTNLSVYGMHHISAARLDFVHAV